MSGTATVAGKAWHIAALGVSVAAALAGCAHTRGSVDARMVLPAAAPRMQLSETQGLLMAVSIEQPMPLYPESAAGGDGRTEVCVSFVVTADGQVSEAAHAPGVDTCAERPDPALVAAALDAVSRWTFFGAAICEYPQGVAPAPDCSGEDAVLRAVPIRLMYAFTFERVGGRGRVAVRRA